jgi:hypothetical protein
MLYCHKTYSTESGFGLSEPKYIYGFFKANNFFPIHEKIIGEYCEGMGYENPIINFDPKIREGFLKDEKKVNLRYSLMRKIPLFGDVFTNKEYPHTLFCFYEFISNEGKVNIWACAWRERKYAEDNFENSFQKFLEKIEELLKERGINPSSDSYNFSLTNKRNIEKFKELNLENYAFKNKKDVLQIFAKREYRDLLFKIKKQGYLTKELSEKDDNEEILDVLKEQELINKSIIIVCSETDKWWNISIKDEENLSKLKELGISCTHCGKDIEYEKTESLYKLTEKSKVLLEKSTWMTGIVVEKLIDLGFNEELIFVNVSYSGEETDIITFHLGEIYIFELKAKEFSIGEYYKFFGRLTRIQNKAKKRVIPVIITTEIISPDVKEILKDIGGNSNIEIDDEESSLTNWVLIEKLDEFETKIIEKINKSTKKAVETRIKDAQGVFPYNFMNKIQM